MRLIAQIVTWVLMPVFMPIYALLLAMYSPSLPIDISHGNTLFALKPEFEIAILLNYLLFTVVAPILMYLIFRILNIIKTVQLDDKKERNIPMILMSIFCLLLFYTFNAVQFILPKYVYALCLSGGLIIAFLLVLNQYLKVSLHATGVGILTGFTFAYVKEQMIFDYRILILVIIVSGIVMSSRLYLEKHSPKELAIGYFLSLFITFVLNFYYPN